MVSKMTSVIRVVSCQSIVLEKKRINCKEPQTKMLLFVPLRVKNCSVRTTTTKQNSGTFSGFISKFSI